MVENKLENDLLSHENSAEEILKESECNYDSYINNNINATIPEPVLSVPPEYTTINSIPSYIISLHTISPNIIYEINNGNHPLIELDGEGFGQTQLHNVTFKVSGTKADIIFIDPDGYNLTGIRFENTDKVLFTTYLSNPSINQIDNGWVTLGDIGGMSSLLLQGTGLEINGIIGATDYIEFKVDENHQRFSEVSANTRISINEDAQFNSKYLVAHLNKTRDDIEFKGAALNITEALDLSGKNIAIYNELNLNNAIFDVLKVEINGSLKVMGNFIMTADKVSSDSSSNIEFSDIANKESSIYFKIADKLKIDGGFKVARVPEQTHITVRANEVSLKQNVELNGQKLIEVRQRFEHQSVKGRGNLTLIVHDNQRYNFLSSKFDLQGNRVALIDGYINEDEEITLYEDKNINFINDVDSKLENIIYIGERFKNSKSLEINGNFTVLTDLGFENYGQINVVEEASLQVESFLNQVLWLNKYKDVYYHNWYYFTPGTYIESTKAVVRNAAYEEPEFPGSGSFKARDTTITAVDYIKINRGAVFETSNNMILVANNTIEIANHFYRNGHGFPGGTYLGNTNIDPKVVSKIKTEKTYDGVVLEFDAREDIPAGHNITQAIIKAGGDAYMYSLNGSIAIKGTKGTFGGHLFQKAKNDIIHQAVNYHYFITNVPAQFNQWGYTHHSYGLYGSVANKGKEL